MTSQSLTSNANAIKNQIDKIPSPYKDLVIEWNQYMEEGKQPYGRLIGFDTRRLYINGFRKMIQYLKPDYSNIYQATIKAIDEHSPLQYSSRKHVKEAAISLLKLLKYKGEANEF